MRCFYCKGRMSAGITAHVVNTDKGVIVIKNVPCEKCEQCGEVVYVGTIVKQLEVIVKELRRSLAEIVIANFDDKVA